MRCGHLYWFRCRSVASVSDVGIFVSSLHCQQDGAAVSDFFSMCVRVLWSLPIFTSLFLSLRRHLKAIVGSDGGSGTAYRGRKPCAYTSRIPILSDEHDLHCSELVGAEVILESSYCTCCREFFLTRILSL